MNAHSGVDAPMQVRVFDVHVDTNTIRCLNDPVKHMDTLSTFLDKSANDGPFQEKEPSPSLGSKHHPSGGCSPCIWYWKPAGCSNKENCKFCHMCPMDELKKRRREKIAKMKKAKGCVEMQTVEIQTVGMESSSSSGSSSRKQSKSEGVDIHAEPSSTDDAAVDQIASPLALVDGNSAGNQQRITVKNTFIHAEFPDVPEASRVMEADNHLFAVGIVFTAGLTFVRFQ